jgi:hypothetical protein
MKKIVIFLFLALTIFTMDICSNVDADATKNNLIGFWEGSFERHGTKYLIYFDFALERSLTGRVEFLGTDLFLRDITLANNNISFTMPNGTVYNGKIVEKTIVASAQNGETITIEKKDKAPSLEEIMAATASYDKRQILYIPASPQDGFYWPYFLALPNEISLAANKQFKQYLLVDTNTINFSSNDYYRCLRLTFMGLRYMRQPSMSIADKLGLPMLFPAFPRPDTFYQIKYEKRYFCEHQFNRDTATLRISLKNKQLAQELKEHYQKVGFDINTLAGLDGQLARMINNAIANLNRNGYQVGPKVLMCGYAASGTFIDRFTALHPELVKAVASGGTLDNMILPLAKYKGEKLIFPIGTYDYRKIAGKPFDIKKHNLVARLIYMGEDDNNNGLSSAPGYSNQEREIIAKLWGVDILPRAKSLIELYGESGGNGIFILDKGMKHSFSQPMSDYIKEFFQANRNSANPVYPIPKDDQQLKYTLYK